MNAKKLLIIGVLSATVISAYLIPKLIQRYFPYAHITNSIDTEPDLKVLAIYNSEKNTFLTEHFEEIEINLNDNDTWNLDYNEIKPSGTDNLLITIKIWDRKIAQKLKDSVYDERLIQLFENLNEIDVSRMYLRINPGMDDMNISYPWANWGSTYNESYKHVTNIINNINENKFGTVWSPSGEPGFMEYYPKTCFDFAGIKLNSFTEEDLYKKLYRLRFVKNEILIFGNHPDKFNRLDLTKIEQRDEFNIAGELNNLRSNAEIAREKLLLGAYDLDEQMVHEKSLKFDHIFINLEEIKNGKFSKILSKTIKRNRIPFITLEIYNPQKRKDRKVLSDFANGVYDDYLDEFYAILDNVESPIYLRFCQEMEIPIQRYPWQSQKPETYIEAYRYFMTYNDSNKQIEKVWGPAGDKGSMDFWPGRDFVDYISLAIYGLPDKNITDFTKQEHFQEIYQRKHRRIKLLQMPIIIGEFGVKGSEKFQNEWLLDAAETIKRHPEIHSVLYFNHQDVAGAWGEIEAPNWKISNSTYNSFTEALKK